MNDIESTVGCPAATPQDGGHPDLFRINALYMIDPASTTEDLGNEIVCMHQELLATIDAITAAIEGDRSQGLAYAALRQAQQVSEVANLYVDRTRRAASAQSEPASVDGTSDATAQTTSTTSAAEMYQALSDADYANNAVRQTLDAIQQAVYSELGPVEQGLYEAAIASTERLTRALSSGIEAGSAQSPHLPGSVQ